MSSSGVGRMTDIKPKRSGRFSSSVTRDENMPENYLGQIETNTSKFFLNDISYLNHCKGTGENQSLKQKARVIRIEKHSF